MLICGDFYQLACVDFGMNTYVEKIPRSDTAATQCRSQIWENLTHFVELTQNMRTIADNAGQQFADFLRKARVGNIGEEEEMYIQNVLNAEVTCVTNCMHIKRNLSR